MAQEIAAQPAEGVLIAQAAAFRGAAAPVLMEPGASVDTQIQGQNIRIVNATNHLIGYALQQGLLNSATLTVTTAAGRSISVIVGSDLQLLKTFRVIHADGPPLECLPAQLPEPGALGLDEQMPLIGVVHHLVNQIFQHVEGVSWAHAASLLRTRLVLIDQV
jgi:hypothetical protein